MKRSARPITDALIRLLDQIEPDTGRTRPALLAEKFAADPKHAAKFRWLADRVGLAAPAGKPGKPST